MLEALAGEQSFGEATLEYARSLCDGFTRRRDGIDAKIADVLEHWDLQRLDGVERNALRVGTVELLGGELPARVVINEAIEIARAFGSSASPGFVNGVLDGIWKKMGGSD